MNRSLALVMMALGASGCGGEDVAVGEAGLASIAGTWTGYVENHQFPSGSDAIRVEVSSTSPLAGSVFFGDGPALDPPTDPDIGYPPALVANPIMDVPGDVYEGFAYAAVAPALSQRRLQLGLAPDELWGEWCELQTSFAGGPGWFICVPNTNHGGGPSDCFVTPNGVEQPVDCAKLELCMNRHVCSCDASGCSAPPTVVRVDLDVVVDQDRMDGSIDGLGDVLNVHLERL